ncbi:preprotein translocase subunit SecE [uncultured Clostridium sp.]|uniref:Preprotein translocase subunit SecE n=1 Tax=Muricoprocola aceti TaxID=2981772 RepID=A0ABT2SIN2_9FIRM|nr:preprotein translocase subunit SecE [Muricoprocola aceti]MCI7227502.1 preprotein translocase subunit SecE [Lachnospiraceae bacterium]SCH10570.1 preprotein translocase subunit SecE [uncultured Clostridium sp.]MCU6724367.1 preprotein translocase subunit SecE [Muricoprocola aceti]MDD7436548.1 preprotein translocase subunit SecE [Lachnospiraceae bacterium]MDY3341413.1 preprotein translocase subunit SecE [Lachnospiraceae bacterium]
MGDNSKNDKVPAQSWSDGLKAEFNKIIWPNKDDLVKQTVAVTVVSVILGTLITVIDSVVQYGINFFIK